MSNITAQFIIEGESLYQGKDRHKYEELKSEVVQRLRNRSARFDKIVECDCDHDSAQLNSFQTVEEGEEASVTRVDVTMSVDDNVLEQLEADQDLVFMKAISELESDKVAIDAGFQEDNIALIAFRKTD